MTNNQANYAQLFQMRNYYIIYALLFQVSIYFGGYIYVNQDELVSLNSRIYNNNNN